MSDEINYKNNPLHGLGLKDLLIEIVDYYGFEILYAYLNINCFKTNPSIASSVKFLKKTDWAREKVESFYLYRYKNLPRASDEQFAIPPRDRIIPNNQTPGEPAKLSIEDAERMHEKRAKKSAQHNQNKRRQSNKPYGGRSEQPRQHSSDAREPSQESPNSSNGNDPWAKWR